MRKFSVLIALALLAVSGTGLAVTCAYDNVPAATLLVPYWRVARNGSTGGDIPEGGVDTLCAITNVSGTGLIAHVTLWNKYSKAVLDFNVPLTAFDVATWRMKDILNGRLNVNPNTQKTPGAAVADVCGFAGSGAAYAPSAASIGFGATRYIRFANPDPFGDGAISIANYATPAFSGSFRTKVWDSLDENVDVTSFTSPGAGVIDVDNRVCPGSGTDGVFAGDFGGYLTIDVVNYCTNIFPDQNTFYQRDAVATTGWSVLGQTPNALIGDIFYIDPNASGGNVSGDPMVALEFDTRLNWNTSNTFYGRYGYNGFETVATAFPGVPAAYQFPGDGREPLGARYGFRYLSDSANSLQSWAIVWRSDSYNNPTIPFPIPADVNLCDWYVNGGGTLGRGFGFYDAVHKLTGSTYDQDENKTQAGGTPSGGDTGSDLYIFLESQRISLLNNGDINPANYKAGWIDLPLNGNTDTRVGGNLHNLYQAYVGVQSSGPGLAISVGHSASLINEQFICSPALVFGGGNTP